MPFLLAISGGSGSGKTFVSEAIVSRFPDSVAILNYDNYYKDQGGLPFEERTKLNYDSPDMFDSDLFLEHLKMLREGKAIDVPQYDFATHSRKKETARLEPKPLILVEGIMVLLLPKENYDYAVFVDADADVRLARRVLRDMVARGRSAESIVKQYLRDVKPMHDRYVAPCKDKADLVFVNNGKEGLDEAPFVELLKRLPL